MNGKRIRILAARAMPAGEFNERWDGTDSRGRPISSGVYFYRLDAGSFTRTRKMVLLK